MGFSCFFKEKTKTCFIKQTDLKNPGGLFFFKKGFFSTLTIFQSFFDIFP